MKFFYPARYNDRLIAIMASEIGANSYDLKREIIEIENQIELKIKKKIKRKAGGKNEHE